MSTGGSGVSVTSGVGVSDVVVSPWLVSSSGMSTGVSSGSITSSPPVTILLGQAILLSYLPLLYLVLTLLTILMFITPAIRPILATILAAIPTILGMLLH